jgi:hypothetical protein
LIGDGAPSSIVEVVVASLLVEVSRAVVVVVSGRVVVDSTASEPEHAVRRSPSAVRTVSDLRIEPMVSGV